MNNLRFSRSPLCVSLAAAMLAGCGGSQPAIGVAGAMPQSVAMSHVRTTSGSEDCPALPEGTGILPDGDFSQAIDPEQKGPTYKKGYVFAPDWEVSKGNIDFNGRSAGRRGLSGQPLQCRSRWLLQSRWHQNQCIPNA